MSNHWLLKTEPATYSYDDLERERRTTWDGVRNALALIHLRQMAKGDDVLVYHSGAAKAIVGRARVATGPVPDPKAGDPKLVAVDLVPAGRLATPVPLAAIKADPLFKDFALVRMSRLSVMPVTSGQWKRLVAMGQG
jgi:predicted RNA-binding protein with PUA-like domain